MVTGVVACERAPVDPADGGRQEDGPEGGPRRRWIRITLVCSALAAFVGVVGFATGSEVRANDRFDQARRTLDATRGHLAGVRVGLAAARGDLRAVDAQVGADTTSLAQDTAQLQGVASALAGAQAGVSGQTSEMHDLKACLAGVEQGLNALSVGDRVHALGALQAVATSCSAVSATGG